MNSQSPSYFPCFRWTIKPYPTKRPHLDFSRTLKLGVAKQPAHIAARHAHYQRRQNFPRWYGLNTLAAQTKVSSPARSPSHQQLPRVLRIRTSYQHAPFVYRKQGCGCGKACVLMSTVRSPPSPSPAAVHPRARLQIDLRLTERIQRRIGGRGRGPREVGMDGESESSTGCSSRPYVRQKDPIKE